MVRLLLSDPDRNSPFCPVLPGNFPNQGIFRHFPTSAPQQRLYLLAGHAERIPVLSEAEIVFSGSRQSASCVKFFREFRINKNFLQEISLFHFCPINRKLTIGAVQRINSLYQGI